MIVVSFPPPAKPLNLNQRLHWAAKMKLTEAWRTAAKVAALTAVNTGAITRNQPFSVIRLSLPVRSLNIRRDPHNWIATTKPVLDGLVDAGVFADDNSDRVATLEPRFHDLRDDGFVSVLIRPATPDGEL